MHCQHHLSSHQTLLKKNNLKTTLGRLALLDIFEHSEKPLSIKDLSGKLGSQRDLDLATLYRNVGAFKSLGVIAEVNIDSGNAFYELSVKPHHHHLVCEVCGRVEDVKNCPSPKISQKLLAQNGFAKLNRHSMEFFGICKKCQKRE